jgi:2-polyprenyl-6-hydroxyphenyl methylase/3-demethylubiquinone-9 3-methyltransferase
MLRATSTEWAPWTIVPADSKTHRNLMIASIVPDTLNGDRLWNAIVGNGGQESACGWCKDKWGLSWQITPRALTQAIADPDRAAAKRAFEAMMKMGKIDIAAIDAARRG